VLLCAQPLSITLAPSDYNGYNISCFGLKDGSIDATAIGGTPPYSFSWSNRAVTEDLTNVPAGYYHVVVMDADSVSAKAEITLTEPISMKVVAQPFRYPNGYNISCYECFNGSIDVSVSYGIPPYTYDWGDEVHTQDRTGLGAMKYGVKVTDANECAASSETVYLTQPERKDWTMEGNANTDASQHFFGSTDEQDVVFKSNGTELLRLTAGGLVKLAGVGGNGVLGIDADGVVGPLPGLSGNNAVPCADDVFPFWRTGGNELMTCDPTRAVLGSLDARHVNFITNNDVRMRLTSSGQVQIGGDLEEWPETNAAGRVNILQGHGNWLTLKTQGTTPGAASALWGLHNPSSQDRLMFYHQPVTGDPLYNVLTLHADGRLASHDLTVFPDGAVGIGTESPSPAGMRLHVDGGVHADRLVLGDVTAPSGYRLFVKNGILAEKVVVTLHTSNQWSDHVFMNGYHLIPLDQLASFISENKHLPGVPSADCMVEEGLDVVRTDALLLQKIEELTLYIIDLNARFAELQRHCDATTKGSVR
jgi:hypothetical protein